MSDNYNDWHEGHSPQASRDNVIGFVIAVLVVVSVVAIAAILL